MATINRPTQKKVGIFKRADIRAKKIQNNLQIAKWIVDLKLLKIGPKLDAKNWAKRF